LAFLTSIYSKASEQNLFLNVSLLSEDIAIVDETEFVIYMSVERGTASIYCFNLIHNVDPTLKSSFPLRQEVYPLNFVRNLHISTHNNLERLAEKKTPKEH
jgi:hypothetical protein